MIDKRELLETARQRGLNLQIVEKDYVLGWLLYGLKDFDELVFKGGTALSKIYFPQVWRLSEDLDFAFTGNDFKSISGEVDTALSYISKESGIRFRVKSKFSNPQYLQLKIGYDAAIGQNWIKVDATKEDVLDKMTNKSLIKTYSDYPDFTVKVESLEEIFSEKIRSLLERTKCRDYFDVWKLCSIDFKRGKVKELFEKKCEIKGIEFRSFEEIFAENTEHILKPYWEQELGRLLNPLPDLQIVLRELMEKLDFLE